MTHIRRISVNKVNRRGFATEPALARALIARAVEAENPAAWVAGDEVSGNDPTLARWASGRAGASQGSHGLIDIAARRRRRRDARENR